MPEQCLLNRLVGVEGETIVASELPSSCQACLARTALRLGIYRPHDETAVRFTSGKRTLVQLGEEGSYYTIPGRTRESRLECEQGVYQYGLNDAAFGSPVVERRLMRIRSEQKLLDAWNKKFANRDKLRKIILPRLRKFCERVFLAEELVMVLCEELIEKPVKEHDNLIAAAYAISEMERYIEILLGGQTDANIAQEIWMKLRIDPLSFVSAVETTIIDKRRHGTRKDRDELPPPPKKPTDLAEYRIRRRHR